MLRRSPSLVEGQVLCEFCSKRFDTQKKRRYVTFYARVLLVYIADRCSNHVLSVHRKRFTCHVWRCPLQGQAFGLRADLRRHQRSAHSEALRQQKQPCPIPGCQTMMSHRKDNARRHLMQTHELNGDAANRALTSMTR
jgi:hypothetical protein